MSFCNYRVLFLALILPVFSAISGSAATTPPDSIDILIKQGIKDMESIDKANELIDASFQTPFVADSMVKSAQVIVERARQLGYDEGLADALLNLVRAYLSSYESTKALEYGLEAYTLFEKENNHEQMAYTLLQLGIIYYTQQNYIKSLEYYNSSVNEYEKVGDKLHIATLFYLSGINYSKLKNHSSAMNFFNRAKEIKQTIGDERGVAECNIGIAELYLSINKPDSAIFFLELASEFTIRTNNVYGNAKADILKSEAYFLKKDYKNALKTANLGLEGAYKVSAKELLVDAHKIIYRVQASQGDFVNAYQNLMSYMNLRDSLINEKTSRNFSKLEGEYILEKKQSEILLLEKENRNRAILLRASIIIGILALLLSLLYYNKNTVINKANKKLEQAYTDLETTQQQLVQQEKLASLGQLTAGIAHEIKNPLNFVNNFSHLSVDLISEIIQTKDPAEKEAIFRDLRLNLEKIAHHGERANSIVTRMLEHSRTGKREIEPTDINKLIKEYAQLSYQALRIKHPGFACKIVLTQDEKIPVLSLVSQEISRVLLNIFNNCLYVLAERHEDDPAFKAQLSITTILQQGQVSIEIKDNGPGIPEKIREQIFQPFFTTKPAGEGTGLGLSISYDIIKAHGGNIIAVNNPEGGAAFIITIPVKPA